MIDLKLREQKLIHRNIKEKLKTSDLINFILNNRCFRMFPKKNNKNIKNACQGTKYYREFIA